MPICFSRWITLMISGWFFTGLSLVLGQEGSNLTFPPLKLLRWGGYSAKFYTGRFCPEIQSLNTLLYTIFWQKRYFFYIPAIWKWYPFCISSLEFCISYNFCKLLIHCLENLKATKFPLLFRFEFDLCLDDMFSQILMEKNLSGFLFCPLFPKNPKCVISD